MPSVETVIVAVTLVAAAALIGGTAGTLYQLRPYNPRRVTWRARYRRGRHHHPSLLARLAGAREMATASALLKGVPL